MHAALYDIICSLVNVEDLVGRTAEAALGGDPSPLAVLMIANKREDDRNFLERSRPLVAQAIADKRAREGTR